jgi:hypothetical protein
MVIFKARFLLSIYGFPLNVTEFRIDATEFVISSGTVMTFSLVLITVSDEMNSFQKLKIFTHPQSIPEFVKI